jgi:hypothetical protein
MNIKKLDKDIKLLLPNLSKDGQILVEFFMPIIREIEEENERFRQEHKAMRDQLSKNSRNSPKPPSQDPNRPVKPGSEKSGAKRLAGGQKGHKDQGGKLKDNTDPIVP